MALTLTSPGVQINEKDLSLRANLPAGTTVVVPGFAPQGPSTEPLQVTSASELEAIYGTPTTAAERYFYYSCREVLNSPANLTTIRLPYGEDTGAGFSSAYSGLFYPMTSSTNGWSIGTPIHKTLSVNDYHDLETGNFTWVNNSSLSSITTNVIVNSSVTIAAGVSSLPNVSAINTFISNLSTVDPSPTTYDVNYLSGGAVTITFQASATQTINIPATGVGFDTTNNIVNAGFFVINDLQTAINELGEGYYVGFASNLGLSANTVTYNSIQSVNTLSSSTSDFYATIPTGRLDFQLSATQIASDQGVLSVSETLQKAGFYDYGTNTYSDHISLGVYKIRRSTVDANVLSIINIEKFIGSLDSTRLQTSPTGGTLANAFIEDIVNRGSSTIKVFVNPTIAKANWYNPNTNVRTQVQAIDNSAKALFALGSYTPNAADQEASKIIGDVPAKLDRALRTIESIENTTVDVVVDAGLSTVYSTVQALNVKSFDDTTYVPSVSSLNENWSAVTNYLVNFAQNTRKDCMAIIDPSRQIFVTGKDSKVISASGKTFTQDIFNPLKTQIGSYGSNYAATYGNWVKVNDLFTNRNVWVPFSGYAAAVFARNDEVAQPWAAPGGLNRGTFLAVDIAFNPNQKQRDRLYEIAVNPVVLFSGDGYAIYGQKTLQTKPTAFDRINVRRLFLALERSVRRSLKYFVFEPNTNFTRSRLKNTIVPIFDYAKNTEGLYDYLIVADERNNTPDIIDQNQLIVDIYLKPVRTAEFILVNFIATRTGQDFQELI
jgi:phage tail sheath protein FI